MAEWQSIEKNVWEQVPPGQMRKAKGKREDVCMCMAIFIK